MRISNVKVAGLVNKKLYNFEYLILTAASFFIFYCGLNCLFRQLYDMLNHFIIPVCTILLASIQKSERLIPHYQNCNQMYQDLPDANF